MKTKASTVHTAKSAPAEKTAPFNALLRQPLFGFGQKKPARNVLHYEKISKATESAIVSFYEQLVPGDKTRPINIELIVEKGFPAFENTIGVSDFKKIKKYFGIDCKANKGAFKPNEINALIGKLRTIENAQFYLHEYSTLIEDVASRLCQAPESMTTLEKAKFVRMYYTIFVGYYYFAEDFVFLCRKGNTPEEDVYTIDIDFNKALKNNLLPYYPEELFDQYKKLIIACKPNQLFYERICYELSLLDKKLVKEILQFAELKSVGEDLFESVNVTTLNQTFSSIRNIKNRVHPYMGVYPIETFACFDRMCLPDFDDLFLLYKICKIMPVEKCPTITEKVNMLEGSRIVSKDRIYYQMAEGKNKDDGFIVSGDVEVNRFITMVEFMAANRFKMKCSDQQTRDVGLCLAVINFCNTMKYIDASATTTREFEIADKLISMDTDNHIFKYLVGEIDNAQLKELLGIDEKFEKEFFGIEKAATPEETAINFAVENGYVSSSDEISSMLIENVIVSDNEEVWVKYAEGKIDIDTLKKRIGFEEDFSEMYFNLSKVDMTQIEARLQELKRSFSKKDSIKKSTLVIRLYCYLIENQVPCGPKNKAPKRNKGLKPSNLLALIS